ncbi:hypothetical protein H7F15_15415 [Pontibacter sp. Tf4]|uniref:hypothetical protein n=1 Tax=Pontibacter sp. Tf4 TaxID=2761620 RepID=UPI0016297D25|nr:hypothetical protein [Pontibacter sp. Tf4]MBB6612435.1 hypothetical protein [Pontibacter sp. Tf4]
MERNEHYYERNYNQYEDGNRSGERYSQRGNYYGMSGNDYGSGNVRMQQRSDFNEFSSGPSGGYGAGNYNDIHRNRDDHYRYGDDNHFRRSHGYTGQSNYSNQDYRSPEYRNRTNQYSAEDSYSRSQPYSSGYDIAGNRQYARQENSYQNPGHGRRYSDYGRDERYNYSHELTDIHHDRGEVPSSSENDYNPGNKRDYYDHRADYRYSGSIESRNSSSDRDNYATGLYSSNRAYLADHPNESDGERYSSRERRHPRSGPDYSASSPISGYGNESFGL